MAKNTDIKYGLGRLRLLLGNLVPNTVTNIFSIMINGIDAGFSNLENMLTIHKRDSNILTTQNVKALRSLTAGNGYEPNLSMAAEGNVTINFKPAFFNRNGSNIYLAPYAKFKCMSNSFDYYFDSGNPLKLNMNNIDIALKEGYIRTVKFENNVNVADNSELFKLYLEENNIVDGSIRLTVNGRTFNEVKTLIGNANSDVFIVKFSTTINNPIVIYVNNTVINDIIDVTYRLCNGIDGIINDMSSEFECNDFINSDGQKINFDDDILVKYQNGFSFAGSGTSVDTLKSQIGYNHNIGIIYDTLSYKQFIGKFTNILLSDIRLHNIAKSINDIFVSRKMFLHNIDDYQDTVRTDKYKFSNSEIENFSQIINDNEYCLSSHNLFNCDTTKYAFQIKLKHSDYYHNTEIKNIVYSHFIKFLNNKNYVLNIDKMFAEYMENNNIVFTYMVFNEKIEKEKLVNKRNLTTNYIIENNGSLPILLGNFNISNKDYEPYKLLFDLTFVV